jgi:hypothetical protein
VAQRGWPLLLASGACGLGAILLLRQHARVATRLLAASAVAAAVLVVPTLVFVFRLDQKSQLECPPLEVRTSDNGGAPRVVIVGGGFGGVAAAKGLRHTPVQITLIDRTNYHVFQPLLYQVTAGILEPGTIATPIRSTFRRQHNVDVRMAEVVAIDKERRCDARRRTPAGAVRLPGARHRRTRQLFRSRRLGAVGTRHEDACGR